MGTKPTPPKELRLPAPERMMPQETYRPPPLKGGENMEKAFQISNAICWLVEHLTLSKSADNSTKERGRVRTRPRWPLSVSGTPSFPQDAEAETQDGSTNKSLSQRIAGNDIPAATNGSSNDGGSTRQQAGSSSGSSLQNHSFPLNCMEAEAGVGPTVSGAKPDVLPLHHSAGSR